MENEIRKGNEVKVEAKIRNPNHPQKGDNTRVDPIGNWKMFRPSRNSSLTIPGTFSYSRWGLITG